MGNEVYKVEKEMTVIKAKNQNRIVLDLSQQRCSKNKIGKLLRELQVDMFYTTETGHVGLTTNYIKVGMYSVRLWLYENEAGKLKDFDIGINIYESDDPKSMCIELLKDKRFSTQYWANADMLLGNKIRLKHLTDIVYHCQRLDQLKIFL